MNVIESKTVVQAQMLANRLRKRFQHLRKWSKRMNVDAFRLYDRDIPEIPLVLDWYDGIVSGALYERPYEKDETEEAEWLKAMRDAVAEALGIDRSNIIIKQRKRQRGLAQYEKIDRQGLTRIISEDGLRFRVNLSDYLDTGLFLDRRFMRRMIRAEAAGKRMLNLFCYTASFSVYAAAGGAASTDSVDLSNTYLDWARENFALNGIQTQTFKQEEFFNDLVPNFITQRHKDTKERGKIADYSQLSVTPCLCERHFKDKLTYQHQLIRADVPSFLRRAAQNRLRWDLIVLDPPAFSNSTMAADFDLRRDYQDLLKSCLSLLAPDGKLWFSVSARSFKANAAELQTALNEHFPGITAADYSGKCTDEDFNIIKMPKAFLLMRN